PPHFLRTADSFCKFPMNRRIGLAKSEISVYNNADISEQNARNGGIRPWQILQMNVHTTAIPAAQAAATPAQKESPAFLTAWKPLTNILKKSGMRISSTC